VPGNEHEAWINFEAGALAKSVLEGRLAPFLVGLRPDELKGPLAGFQATVYEEEDVFLLVRSINTLGGTRALPEPALRRHFQERWPALQECLMPAVEAANRPTPEPERSRVTDVTAFRQREREERRMRTIVELRPLIVSALDAFDSLTRHLELASEPSKREKIQIAQDRRVDLLEYVDRDGLYLLNDGIIAELRAVLKAQWMLLGKWMMKLAPPPERDDDGSIRRMFETDVKAPLETILDKLGDLYRE
jgi:hypothetical protein